MLNHIIIDWPSVILDTMLKAKRLPQYPLPFSLLISRICEYKGVNTSDEQVHRTNNANQISYSSLKQMKCICLGDQYMHRDEMPSMKFFLLLLYLLLTLMLTLPMVL